MTVGNRAVTLRNATMRIGRSDLTASGVGQPEAVADGIQQGVESLNAVSHFIIMAAQLAAAGQVKITGGLAGGGFQGAQGADNGADDPAGQRQQADAERCTAP